MKNLLLVLVAALVSASLPARTLAESANIGLYTDVSGNTCSFSGNAPGPIAAYVVFRPDAGGVNTVQFSAPVPSCLGSVYLSEVVTPGMIEYGNSQSGASILLQGCFSQPVSVLRINLMRSASTDPCCPYPILPDPSLSEIAASNCAYQEVDVTSVVAHFNADATCECEGNSPPTPPELPSPPHNAPSVSITSTFSWWSTDFDNNIAGFDIYLGTTSPPPLVATNVPLMSYTPAAPLAELTPHYWRVVVRDAFGLEQSGPVWAFTTRASNSPPNPPSNPNPTVGAQNVPLNATLSWQASDIDLDPLTYDVYFGNVSPPPLVSSNQSGTTYTPAGLVYGTLYYWRIVVRDDDELETTGPEWFFTTRPSNLPPNAPSNPTPPNFSSSRPINQTLAWTGSDSDGDPLTYDIYFGTSATPALVATNWPSPNYSPGTLVYNTLYFWRVVARDPLGQTTSGPTWRFTTTTGNNPPSPPSNPSPPHGSTGNSIATTLAWTCSDPNGDALTYVVHFGTTSPPPFRAITTLQSFNPGTLVSGTTYFWRIVAMDAHESTWGAIWSFSTTPGNSPPLPPSNPFPANNAIDVSRTVTLGWNCSDPNGDALTYRVYFGEVFPPPLVASNVAVASYSPGLLDYFTPYYWRIVVVDAHGDSTTGNAWSFRTRPVNRPPDVPYNPSPANNATGQSLTTNISWTAGDLDGDPVVFDVYFGTANPPPLVAAGHVPNSYSPGALQLTTQYYWRIVAHDTVGASSSGPTWNFTTRGNVAPNPPFGEWPDDGGTAGLTPLLAWNASDPDGQPLTYVVHFGTTSPPPFVANVDVNTYAPGTLQQGRTYFWRIGASDGYTTIFGPTWHFVARQAGDLTSDGVLTIGDAQCALDVFLWNAACGGPHAYTVGDVDCNEAVTPGDARCIHKAVIDGSCDLCDRAVRPNAPSQRPAQWPVVTLASLSTQQGELVVRLAVSGITTMEAFGFYAMTDARLSLTHASGVGPASNFAVLETTAPSTGSGVVGGYSLSSHPVDGTTAFVDLFFDIDQGIHGDIFIDGFVDALWGASQLYIPLGAVVSAPPLVSELTLHQNHPNPFNPQTTISYELPASLERTRVRLSIHDISGREIATLVDDEQPSGSHVARWNGQDANGERVASGVYFYVLQAGDERRTRKMVLLK